MLCLIFCVRFLFVVFVRFALAFDLALLDWLTCLAVCLVGCVLAALCLLFMCVCLCGFDFFQDSCLCCVFDCLSCWIVVCLFCLLWIVCFVYCGG